MYLYARARVATTARRSCCKTPVISWPYRHYGRRECGITTLSSGLHMPVNQHRNLEKGNLARSEWGLSRTEYPE